MASVKNPGLAKLRESYDRQFGEGPNWLLDVMLSVRAKNHASPEYWAAKERDEKALKDWDGIGSALDYVEGESGRLKL